MIVPSPWQRGQVCGIAKPPRLRAMDPRPSHSGHTLGVVPGLGAAAVTGVAGVGLVHRHARRDAVQRVVERDRDVHLQVVAALGRLAPPAAARGAAEETAEDVAEVAHVELRVALAEHARVEALVATGAGPESAGARARRPRAG